MATQTEYLVPHQPQVVTEKLVLLRIRHQLGESISNVSLRIFLADAHESPCDGLSNSVVVNGIVLLRERRLRGHRVFTHPQIVAVHVSRTVEFDAEGHQLETQSHN